jgi:hypothetical protein
MKNRNPHISPMAIMAMIFGLVLLLQFQSCSPLGVSYRSRGGESSDLISSMTGNGNGTGYGGKPTSFYAVDPDVSCTPAGSGTETNVKAIIRVASSDNIRYFQGCEEKGIGQEVNPADVTWSAVNPDVLLYKKPQIGGIFSHFETRPAQVENFDWGVCHFYPVAVPMSGTDFYFSVIQAVTRFNSVSDSYSVGLSYEKVTFIPQQKPVVEQGSVSDGEAFLETYSDRLQYRVENSPVTKLKFYKPVVLGDSPKGWLRWYVGGMFRDFQDGICSHHDL